jgi:hypothetical protein
MINLVLPPLQGCAGGQNIPQELRQRHPALGANLHLQGNPIQKAIQAAH